MHIKLYVSFQIRLKHGIKSGEKAIHMVNQLHNMGNLYEAARHKSATQHEMVQKEDNILDFICSHLINILIVTVQM
jgi:hypothetical protein